MIECIRETIAKELAERDKAVAELRALQENKQAAKSELRDIEKQMQAQAERADDAMRRGGRLNRIDETLMGLRQRREILEQRLERLECIGDDNKHYGLIADASHNLSRARDKLARAVVRALEEPRRKVADEMSEKFRQGMALFDGYNETCQALFKEWDVSLVAGSMELAPLPSCPDLYQLMDSGLLKAARVPTPLKPIAEPEPTPTEAPIEPAEEPEGTGEEMPAVVDEAN
jgi:hypothetical protein